MEMEKKTSAVDYADFAEYDRRQRGIERHVLAAFLGGLAVGLLGMFVTDNAPALLADLYDPYVYLALTIALGATSTGFGWALLTTFLATVSSLVAAMGGSAIQGRFNIDVVGGGPVALNVLLVLLVGLGMLGYLTRRNDLWGDLAAGGIGALVLADVIDRATPGFLDTEATFWPVPAVVVGVLTVMAVLWLRRTTVGRLRALGVTAVLAGLFALFVT
ncbi:hypothetical protein ACFWYW_54730 [Nonomuraea sp. NPDC059023]|uniref:hypothetical protein n=1 Tax=unclassified Nonomuraea TaxID=2593643 RepID=UPI0036C38D76